MHSFRLPYHLIVEEGIFDRIPDVMGDVLPGMGKRKAILVTEENLKGIFTDQLDRITEDFDEIETYLIKAADYDTAVSLAKYITMNNIQIVIGFGGGTVLDLAKFAA
ncbi:MAG: iron-containing alcohol dehydrogenase, partial [Eubacterium sp.]|nr:iron-containing alcohol dehydrogenase [Eubacterium sp.]